MDYKKLINRALELGFSDFEAYITDTDLISINLFQGEVDQTQASKSHTIALRGIYNEQMVDSTLEDEEQDIDEVLNKMIDNASILNSVEKSEIFAGSKEYPTLVREDGGFSKISAEEKINLLKETERIAKELDPRIVLIGHCGYSDASTTSHIINSKGLDVTKSVSYAYIVLQAIAKEGENTQDGFELQLALKYDDLSPEKIAKKVVATAVSMLGAEPIESKSYPVIIENEAMADLLEGFSSMFTGDSAIRRLTSLTDKVGEKIMGEEVTIVDDPLDLRSVNAQPFDDEGVACYRKEVISKGVFKTFLHSLRTAKYFNTTSTGNGAKSNTVVSSPLNMYIEPGTKSKEEMIKDTKEGLLITSLSGLHASLNVVSGDFSAQASGYYIENGEITKPVTLIVVSGNFLKMMSSIDSLGSDLYLGHSGIGAPSIKFKSLPVSGK